MAVMAQQIFPTKGNLIATKKSLSLAKLGYELLDRKRNILIREMMSLMDTANEMRDQIETVYAKAFAALQRANITLGISESAAMGTELDDSFSISYRSVMGVDIPHITGNSAPPVPHYGLMNSNSMLDQAYIRFHNAKEMTVTLAEIENSIFRLSTAIKKTSRRANALKNIVIPRFDTSVKFITDALEEKEREEFSRLKVIKRTKEKQNR